MDGSLTRWVSFPWKKESKAMFQKYLEMGRIKQGALLYKSARGSNEISHVAMDTMVKGCAFSFQETM